MLQVANPTIPYLCIGNISKTDALLDMKLDMRTYEYIVHDHILKDIKSLKPKQRAWTFKFRFCRYCPLTVQRNFTFLYTISNDITYYV